MGFRMEMFFNSKLFHEIERWKNEPIKSGLSFGDKEKEVWGYIQIAYLFQEDKMLLVSNHLNLSNLADERKLSGNEKKTDGTMEVELHQHKRIQKLQLMSNTALASGHLPTLNELSGKQ
uniref:Uncharacterized protein n=1 Tax=Cucumis melo TaxID=3656 RepID=A0A9I9EC54_CUCME